MKFLSVQAIFAYASNPKLIDFVFGSYAVERVQARCVAENRASERVMEKVGMRCGTARSAMLHRGRFFDMRVYSVLRSEWPAATGG